jgi:hypothetical protein
MSAAAALQIVPKALELWNFMEPLFVRSRTLGPAKGGTVMKKTIAGLLMAATILGTLAASVTDASAQWRRGWGWGWGPGIAAGVLGGAVVAGAIIATRPPGYAVYEGYPQPVYAPGCYWASQPIYDGAGRVVGYMGQPVQVCPGYTPPPPGAVPPGYAGAPPVGAPPAFAGAPPVGDPSRYAGGPPSDDAVASCMRRFRSYDPQTGTYLGNDGQRHHCP